MNTAAELIEYLKGLGLDEQTETKLVELVSTEEITPELLETISKVVEYKSKEAMLDADASAKRVEMYDDAAEKMQGLADDTEKKIDEVVGGAMNDLDTMEKQLEEVIAKQKVRTPEKVEEEMTAMGATEPEEVVPPADADTLEQPMAGTI